MTKDPPRQQTQAPDPGTRPRHQTIERNVMELTLIRNATTILEYNGFRILMDPYLAPKGASGSYGRSGSRSPLVDLPAPVETIVKDINAVLLTHVHPDHFDDVAQNALNKDILVICTPPHADAIRNKGFTNLSVIDGATEFNGITITPTPAIHGPESVWHYIGEVSGYHITAPGEASVYFASDTVLCDPVREVIAQHRPDYIVTNSGGAFSKGKFGPIIMDAEQTLETVRIAPWAQCIAIHLDTTDHGRVTRSSLRAFADAQGAALSARLAIPLDGETIALTTREASDR